MELRLPLEMSPGRQATCRAVFGTWGSFPDDARASHCPFVLIDRSIDDLAIIIPNSAVRDEGTSYHYMKPSREVVVNPKYQEEFTKLLTIVLDKRLKSYYNTVMFREKRLRTVRILRTGKKTRRGGTFPDPRRLCPRLRG